MSMKYRFRSIITGCAVALCAAVPVMADDIEIYTSGALGAPTVQPNIMFIVDSSGSMNTTLDVPVSYDYTVLYTGDCLNDSLYFTVDGSIPSCGASNKDYFLKTSNKCDASLNLYDNGSVIDTVGPLEQHGFFVDQIAQRALSGANASWRGPVVKKDEDRALFMECKADSGIHGETGSASPYIENNNSGGWTSTAPADPENPHLVWNGGANNFTVFDGNYLNYLTSATGTSTVSRLDVVKNAVQTMVDVNNNINLGLMVFDAKFNQWEGGSVQFPCLDTNLTRNDFRSRLSTLKAEGSTPLSETYYEALRFFGGGEIVYGNEAVPSNQTGTKELGNPTNYETPITETCQKNYIVYMTDGAPQQDYVREELRAELPDFDKSSCNTDPDPGLFEFSLSEFNKNADDSAGATNDNCLDEFAGWANNNDVALREFDGHAGRQTVGTYTVGFDFDLSDPDLVAAETLLKDTAKAGGGEFYVANDQASLNSAFARIIAQILAVNSTFSSPAVSVNAFNRSTNLDDLYFTLFKPTETEHWEGNLKKFKLEFQGGQPFIADQNGNEAVDPITGFFFDDSQSYWSAVPDGAETAKGGAAGRLTNVRNVYTIGGSYGSSNGVLTPANGTLTSADNELSKSNGLITEAMLNIVGFFPLIEPVPYRETLLDWASGIDVFDDDNDGATDDARTEMGDPLHAEPALVQYGLTATGDPDLVSYVATNDGYLHAINTVNGDEYFSFVPQEMLPSLDHIFIDAGTFGKQYGLDGNVVAWINDVDKNGEVSGGDEHVYLYFGMRRGGSYLYSMDVTNRNEPKLRWVIEGGVGDYAELGQTWSTPNVENIQMGAEKRTVLVFGGGYDTAQDSASVRSPDTIGRSVFIVDANDGKLLWRAGPDAGADLTLPEMKYSIPSRIKPIDIDGDGNVDSLYFGDMGGQWWRIDIDNIANTTSKIFADGGRIADLAADGDVTKTRRFYYPMDVALIVQEGQAPFLAVAAASGYRAHPLNTDIQDRIFMIRDYDVYNTPDFSLAPVTEADLYDTTANEIGEGTDTQIANAAALLNSAKGWAIDLSEGGAWIGEKGLSEPLIINNVLILTTYIPASSGVTKSACEANDGSGRTYFLNIADGTPSYENTGDDSLTAADRSVDLARGGIPPSPTIIITEEGDPTLCVGTECSKAEAIPGLQKLYWYEVEE